MQPSDITPTLKYLRDVGDLANCVLNGSVLLSVRGATDRTVILSFLSLFLFFYLFVAIAICPKNH